MNQKEMQAEIERLKAELAAAKTANVKDISFKVSELGAVSVYGLGRFPVTLYVKQMDRLFESRERYEAFKAEHGAKLSTGKDDARFQSIRQARAEKAAAEKAGK